ncbi:hypothetical protein J4471_02130 [Candidatus Woesearchaeota archaeon]|nr:hypothetical protein [Candidatus Woesearchaeota archaeon]
MVKKLAKDIKVGDKIKVYNEIFLIEKIEQSAIAKHGKSKVRFDTVNEQTKDKGVMIILATDEFELIT